MSLLAALFYIVGGFAMVALTEFRRGRPSETHAEALFDVAMVVAWPIVIPLAMAFFIVAELLSKPVR